MTTADELHRLLRKFRRLRHAEERVLARLVRILGGLPAPNGTSAASPAGETGPIETVPIETGPIEAVPIEVQPIEPVPIEAARVDAASIRAAPMPPVDPSWTKGSLSPFLLVVGDGALVVALPWGAVRRVSLAEEDGLPLPPLRRWLNGGAPLVAANGSNGHRRADGDSPHESGYSVRWGVGADDGLVCEAVRGIFPAGKAEAHGVTVVLLPSPYGGVESVSLEVWVERLFPINASSARAKVNGASHAHPPLEVTPSAPPPAVSPEALICVRSLPARVALARALRLAGWRVTEEPDDEAGLLRWRNGSAVRAYVELPSSPDASRGVESWAAVGGDLVLVSARGAPWEGQLPGALRRAARIVHPFAPAELESCVLPPGASSASSSDTPTVKAPPLPADR